MRDYTMDKVSSLSAILADSTSYTVEKIRDRLKRSKEYNDFELREIEAEKDDQEFLLELKLPKISNAPYMIGYIESPLLTKEFYEGNRTVPVELSKEELEKAKASNSHIIIDTLFPDENSMGFLEQIKLLTFLAPEMNSLYDISGYKIHSGDWARDVTDNNIPPALKMFFSIHSVVDNKKYWFHTHGLKRFKSSNLELYGYREGEDMYEVYRFFESVASASVDQYMPRSEEGFEPVRGLDIRFLSYIKAKKYIKNLVFEDRTDSHPEDNLVILQPGGVFKKYVPPTSITPIMQNNPLVMVSTSETDRMSKLAKKKLSEFIRIAKDNLQNEKWNIIVKLGYQTDTGEEGAKEHLWFLVKDLNNDEVRGELVNQPYDVSSLNKGDIEWHSWEKLTDWVIYTDKGEYTPDRLYLLKREL